MRYLETPQVSQIHKVHGCATVSRAKFGEALKSLKELRRGVVSVAAKTRMAIVICGLHRYNAGDSSGLQGSTVHPVDNPSFHFILCSTYPPHVLERARLCHFMGQE